MNLILRDGQLDCWWRSARSKLYAVCSVQLIIERLTVSEVVVQLVGLVSSDVTGGCERFKSPSGRICFKLAAEGKARGSTDSHLAIDGIL